MTFVNPPVVFIIIFGYLGNEKFGGSWGERLCFVGLKFLTLIAMASLFKETQRFGT